MIISNRVWKRYQPTMSLNSHWAVKVGDDWKKTANMSYHCKVHQSIFRQVQYVYANGFCIAPCRAYCSNERAQRTASFLLLALGICAVFLRPTPRARKAPETPSRLWEVLASHTQLPPAGGPDVTLFRLPLAMASLQWLTWSAEVPLRGALKRSMLARACPTRVRTPGRCCVTFLTAVHLQAMSEVFGKPPPMTTSGWGSRLRDRLLPMYISRDT